MSSDTPEGNQCTAGKDPWKRKDILEDLYHGEGLSSREVAERLGCSGGTIRTWLEKHNISKRDPGGQPTDYSWDDKETLQRLYYGEGLSTYEIADRVGCGESTVRDRMDDHDIPRRGPWESNSPADYAWDEKETLQTLYYGEKLSTYEMADRLGCGETTIRERMDKHNIPRRSVSEAAEIWMPGHDWLTGEDNPAYKHGNSTPQDYGPTWEPSRQAALERDDYKCRACGMTREEHIEENGRDLNVHHIVPFESFDDSAVANQLDNLVTACATHHGKYEGLPVFPG